MRKKIWLAIFLTGAFALAILWQMARYRRSIITVHDGDQIIKLPPANGMSVGQFLAKNKIFLGKDDLINPATDFLLAPASEIYITRCFTEIKISTSAISPQLLYQRKEISNLRPTLIKKYRSGKKTVRTKFFYQNGRLVSTKKISEKYDYSYFTTLTLLDKTTLRPLKTYNLARCRKIKMLATAYYPGDPLAWKNGTETYLGMKMQRGIVAVDPKIIKLRTRVYIPGYGYGYAADTGSAIKGRRIDLGVNNAEEEKEFMHRPVTVYILERAPTY